MGHTSELQISVVKLIDVTSFNSSDMCLHTFLYSSGRAEKYFRDGKLYLGSRCSSRRRNPSLSTTERCCESKTINSITFSVMLVAFTLPAGSFSRLCSASTKVSCIVVLSAGFARSSACSLAWCFWRCLFKFVVLNLPTLSPPLATFALQILHVAVGLVGVSSLKCFQIADLARSGACSMLLCVCSSLAAVRAVRALRDDVTGLANKELKWLDHCNCIAVYDIVAFRSVQGF